MGSMLESRFHKTILQSIQLDECPSLSTEFQAPAPELMEAPCSRTVENEHGIDLSRRRPGPWETELVGP